MPTDPIIIRPSEVPHGEGGRRRIIYRADFTEQAILAPRESEDHVLREARRRIGLRIYGEIQVELERLLQQQLNASPDHRSEALEVLHALSKLVQSHISGDFPSDDAPIPGRVSGEEHGP